MSTEPYYYQVSTKLLRKGDHVRASFDAPWMTILGILPPIDRFRRAVVAFDIDQWHDGEPINASLPAWTGYLVAPEDYAAICAREHDAGWFAYFEESRDDEFEG